MGPFNGFQQGPAGYGGPVLLTEVAIALCLSWFEQECYLKGFTVLGVPGDSDTKM